MQLQQPAPPGIGRRLARGAAVGLLVYGAAGVALQLRLLDLLSTSILSLGGAATFHQTPEALPFLAPLFAHYAAQPWLPWASWLAGLALLAGSRPALPPPAVPGASAAPPAVAPALGRRGRGAAWLLAGLLLGLLALGAYARLNLLLPQARGLTQAPYDDEGVYAGAGQLLLQGILPYRDFFFAHPPLAALVYTPALAYHFTPWGSVTSFMLARYLAVGYSLGALLALFAIGWQLGRAGATGGLARWRGLACGATAAGLWAIDGRAIEINRKIMLDQPMILASLLAIVVYLAALRRLDAGGRGGAAGRLLLGAGALAALSAFTKIQGLACIVALGGDLLLRVRWRGAAAPGAGPARLVALGGGFVAVAGAVVSPFLLLAPSAFVRMVGFFQLLRPSDGLVQPPDRIRNLSAVLPNGPNVLQNGPTIYLAALGFGALTWWATRALAAGAAPSGAEAAREQQAVSWWRPIVVWSFLSIVLFTYSRSFYSHYYIQLVAPLCLLGGAVWLPLLRPQPARGLGTRARALGYAVLLLPALVLAVPAWQGFTTRYDDPIFAIVGRFITDAVPPETPVLVTDEQFAFLASRPPSHAPTGYLIDSYGHMIFLGLHLGDRSWGDLVDAALHGTHSNDVYAMMRSPAPQADFLDRARRAALVVVHKEGEARLLPGTLQTIEQLGTVRERQPRYVIVAPRAAH
ncbi:MAG TPA: hypothetical protein VKY74_05470 [Chloroflexia bacterium]|nr:hypothetical protein [Chloroflexia bacterium]